MEWVAYHRSIGFDHIAIASNDCDDGSDLLVDAMQECGFVTHHKNGFGPLSMPQHAAWRRIQRQGFYHRAEYLMILDADEFLNVHIGQRSIRDLAEYLNGRDFLTLC